MIVLDWDDVADATYSVYSRRTDVGGAYTLLASGVAVSTYDVTSEVAAGGTQYDFVVTATRPGESESEYSNAVLGIQSPGPVFKLSWSPTPETQSGYSFSLTNDDKDLEILSPNPLTSSDTISFKNNLSNYPQRNVQKSYHEIEAYVADSVASGSGYADVIVGIVDLTDFSVAALIQVARTYNPNNDTTTYVANFTNISNLDVPVMDIGSGSLGTDAIIVSFCCAMDFDTNTAKIGFRLNGSLRQWFSHTGFTTDFSLAEQIPLSANTSHAYCLKNSSVTAGFDEDADSFIRILSSSVDGLDKPAGYIEYDT